MAYTTSSTLGELMADPQIVAIIEKYVPGSTEDPNMKNGGKVKISTFLKFPQAGKKGFTPEVMDKILEEANALWESNSAHRAPGWRVSRWPSFSISLWFTTILFRSILY